MNTEIVILYDFYKKLLKEKEREYFENYYFNNYSLAEIAENLEVSRNNIHRSLKKIEEKLYDYEEKLNLKQKNDILNNLIENLDEDLKEKIRNCFL